MPIALRYVTWKLLGGFLALTTGIVLIIWLSQSLRFIDYIVNRGLPLSGFLKITALLMPSYLLLVMPTSLFVAVLFIYRKLMLDKEIVAFHALGRSKLYMARPAMLATVIVVIFGMFLQLYLMPNGYRKFKDFQSEIRDNFGVMLLEAGVFQEIGKGVTLYARTRDDNGVWHGLLLQDNRDRENLTTLMASDGKIVRTDTGLRAVLSDGSRHVRNGLTNDLSILDFDRYTFDLELGGTAAGGTRYREANERYLHELFDPGTDPSAISNKDKLLAEAHKRLSWPIWTLALALTACVTVMAGSYSRRENRQQLLAGIVAMIIVQALSLVIANFAANQVWANSLQYILSLVIVISLFSMLATLRNRAMPPGYNQRLA